MEKNKISRPVSTRRDSVKITLLPDPLQRPSLENQQLRLLTILNPQNSSRASDGGDLAIELDIQPPSKQKSDSNK